MMVMMIMATAVALLVVMVVVLMVMALAFLIVVVVVVMLMLVATAVALLIVIVMVVMLVATALALLVVIVMMVLMVMALALLVVIVVVVMLMATAVALLIVIVVMVVMMTLCGEALKLCFKGVSALHSLKKLLTVQLIPRGGDDNCGLVMLAEKLNCGGDLGVAHTAGVTHYDSSCVVYLIKEELAEVSYIHLALICVANGGEAVENDILKLKSLNRLDDVGELTDSRRLDEYTLGGVLLDNLVKSLAEIAHKATADATRIHFVYGDSRILKEASVYTDITELVLDKNYLFSCVSLGEHLLDKGGFSCAQEARKNVDLGHVFNVLSFLYRCFCFCDYYILILYIKTAAVSRVLEKIYDIRYVI